MARINKVAGLEIEQDLRFQELNWRAQRAGWIILALLVGLALLGLFGDGLLANARASSPEAGVAIDYQRFIRNQAQFSFIVHLSPDAIADGKVRLVISDEYLENFHIEGIVPEPSREAATAQGKLFEFDVSGDQISPGITFFLRPTRVGQVDAQINIAEGEIIHFRQFIYP